MCTSVFVLVICVCPPIPPHSFSFLTSLRCPPLSAHQLVLSYSLLSPLHAPLYFCHVLDFKAYIPRRRNIPGVGGWRWAMHPTPEFCVGDTINMLVSWSQRNPTQNHKICVLPHAKPKRKPVEYRLRWVPTQNAGVGHVHFKFFVYISFAFGTQRESHFQWNMGLTLSMCHYFYPLFLIHFLSPPPPPCFHFLLSPCTSFYSLLVASCC